MKALKLLLISLLSLVFSTEIEAQQQGQGNILADISTSVIQHDVTNTISIDHSPNRQYTVIAADGYNGDGFAAVYCNTCTGYTYGHEIATYILHKGTTGAVGVDIGNNSATVSNNGNVYVLFTSTIIGNTARNILQKNGVEIYTFDGVVETEMQVFNNYLYIFMADENGNYWLYKIDENTDQVIFSVPVTNGDIGEMLLMPNGNIAGKVRPGGVAEGNLYEFDANTGAELGLIRSGNPYGREKFGTNGDLEVYDRDLQKFLVYSQSSGWASVVKETNLPDSTENLFRLPVKDWEFNGGEFHGIYYQRFMTLSDELVHGSVAVVLSNTYGMLDIWFNSDETYTVIYKDNSNAIHMLKVANTQLDTSLIPTIHIAGDIVDGRNGEVYDNGWQTADPHILTLVMDDADMPNIGDTPSPSWITPPSGYTYGAAFPVRNDGQGLVYDAICYNTNATNNKVIVRVFIKPASEVVGVRENTLADFKIWPNPATDYIKFSAEKEISQLEILDRSGRSIMMKENVEGSVFVGDLTPGIYFIRVRSGNQTGTRKWVKL